MNHVNTKIDISDPSSQYRNHSFWLDNPDSPPIEW